MGVLKSLVQGNLHTLPMEGCWKFQKCMGGGGGVGVGLGSLKAKIFEGKLMCNLGSDFQPKYFPWGGMDIFWDKTIVGNYYFQMSRN